MYSCGDQAFDDLGDCGCIRGSPPGIETMGLRTRDGAEALFGRKVCLQVWAGIESCRSRRTRDCSGTAARASTRADSAGAPGILFEYVGSDRPHLRNRNGHLASRVTRFGVGMCGGIPLSRAGLCCLRSGPLTLWSLTLWSLTPQRFALLCARLCLIADGGRVLDRVARVVSAP